MCAGSDHSCSYAIRLHNNGVQYVVDACACATVPRRGNVIRVIKKTPKPRNAYNFQSDHIFGRCRTRTLSNISSLRIC